MSISFKGKVAIVTGAGNGLGRSHALALAERGACVVVNDLGGDRSGAGASSKAADDVVQLIKDNGGDAFAHGANVANFDEVQDMVQATIDKWGRIDILVNNAGILRDKSFGKMSIEDFKMVMDVHLMGSVHCTKAVWNIMKEQDYGRIVMTTSSSGMFGNFGQSNYGAAKMAVVGFMNTLVLESAKQNITVNCLAPTAGTRMTEGLIPEEYFKLLTPESVTAGALVLCGDDAPNGTILSAGAGGYATAALYETDGIYLPEDQQTPENVVAQWDAVTDTKQQQALESGPLQTQKFLMKAIAHAEKGE